MSKPKDNLGNLEFVGKTKTQTFKQFQLERPVKEGNVILASRFAEIKELELQRIQELKSLLRMRNAIEVRQLVHLKTS